MARGKAGKIRQNGKDHGINPKARIPSRRNVGVSFQERHSTGFQIERFRRLQKTSDTTEVNHRKRNFGGCGQWTTFRDGRMRHPGSRRMADVFPSPVNDALPILRGDVSALMYHRRPFRNHRRSYARTRSTIRTLRKTSSSARRRHASSTDVDSHAVTEMVPGTRNGHN